MFKKILMLLIVSLLAGCTILHYPKHVSMISANEQRLVFSAEEIACSKILKIDKAEIAHTEVLIKKMSDQIKSSCDVYSLSEYTKKKDDLEKNLASMKSANKLMEKWKGKKMYIDVIGNNEKSRLFEHLVGNNLRNTDVLITTDKKLAEIM